MEEGKGSLTGWKVLTSSKAKWKEKRRLSDPLTRPWHPRNICSGGKISVCEDGCDEDTHPVEPFEAMHHDLRRTVPEGRSDLGRAVPEGRSDL